MKTESVGIKNIAIEIPVGVISNEEMADWGGQEPNVLYHKTKIKQKPALLAGEDLIDLSIKTVAKLLQDETLSAKNIDYIIFATAAYDLQFNCPSSRIANAVGAGNAKCFDIINGCNAGNLAIDIGRMLLKEHNKSNVIIACADQLSPVVNYQEKDMQSILSFADGCAAVLLQKMESAPNTLLSYEYFTKPEYHNFIVKDKATGKLVLNNADATVRQSLKMNYLHHTIKIIDSLLQRQNIQISDIRHICINQGNPWLIDELITHYQLADDVIQQTYANYGHMGCVDNLFGLKNTLDSHKIKTGDHYLLLASGIGFSWSGHILKH